MIFQMLRNPTVLQLMSQMLADTRGNYLWEDGEASENAARPAGVDSKSTAIPPASLYLLCCLRCCLHLNAYVVQHVYSLNTFCARTSSELWYW